MKKIESKFRNTPPEENLRIFKEMQKAIEIKKMDEDDLKKMM